MEEGTALLLASNSRGTDAVPPPDGVEFEMNRGGEGDGPPPGVEFEVNGVGGGSIPLLAVENMVEEGRPS